jgi:hypothetical protein
MRDVKIVVEPPIQKTANPIAKFGPAAAGAIGTSLGLDLISHGGDYSNISGGRVANAVLNALLGGAGGHRMKTDLFQGAGTIGLAPMKDFALAGVGAAHEAEKALKNLNKKDPIKEAIKDYLIPGAGLAILGGTAAATASAAIPALQNISRAADRVGDGRAIRVSTSIRKRPNQTGDLKLVVMSPEQAKEIEEARRQEREDSAEVEPPKGLLSRIFG